MPTYQLNSYMIPVNKFLGTYSFLCQGQSRQHPSFSLQSQNQPVYNAKY